jgi:hypothetical protein
LNARVLTPELLDSLPADDPEAIRSRADLRMINHLMGNYRWFYQVLLRSGRLRADAHVVELGAGDGTLARCLLARAGSLRYEALDLAPPPPGLPAGCVWHQADLFDALPRLAGKADAVIANLFLHHFDDHQLREIGALLSTFPLVAICEPWRHPRFHLAGYALNLLGINRVTRHDLHVSIDAGFAANELAERLGLKNASIQCSTLGACRLLWTR